MEGAIFIGRIILAGLFVLSSGAKLMDRERFRKSLRDFGVPAQRTRLLSWLVPLSELTAAVLLVTSPSVGAIAALILLLIFTGGVSYNLVLGRQPECSCFGQIGSSAISAQTIVRNALLALLAAVLVIESPSPLQSEQRMLLVLVLILAAIAGALFALVYELARRQEGLSRQTEDLQDFLESGAIIGGASRAAVEQPHQDLPLGAPAPSFKLNSVEEREISFGDLLSAGKPLVIFFLSSDCAPCTALLPEINLWRHELDASLAFAIVSKGSLKSNYERYSKARLDSTIPILVDLDGEVAGEYMAKWTPSAISLTTDGSVASQLAVGDKQIRSLLDHLSLSSAGTPWLAEAENDGAAPRM
jgi:peroxiredoxin